MRVLLSYRSLPMLRAGGAHRHSYPAWSILHGALGKSETPLLQMLSPKMICGAARSRAVLFLATSNFYIPEGYEDTARHLAYSSRGAQASARTGWG